MSSPGPGSTYKRRYCIIRPGTCQKITFRGAQGMYEVKPRPPASLLLMTIGSLVLVNVVAAQLYAPAGYIDAVLGAAQGVR